MKPKVKTIDLVKISQPRPWDKFLIPLYKKWFRRTGIHLPMTERFRFMSALGPLFDGWKRDHVRIYEEQYNGENSFVERVKGYVGKEITKPVDFGK